MAKERWYTNEKRTQRFLKELKRWVSESSEERYFPEFRRRDVFLILDPKGIYTPFIDQKWGGGGHVAKSYFIRGLDFLKNQPVVVIGDSNKEINYYAPHLELDLKIIYDGAMTFPLKITTEGGMWENESFKISNSGEFQKMVGKDMFVDAYEWRDLAEGYFRDTLCYSWLPHPAGLNEFIELFKKFAHSKRKKEGVNTLEETLRNYYQNLEV